MAYENAYAARIDNGVVREVIVIPYMDDDDAKATAYCNSIGLAGTWVDTSYNGSRRGKFAGVGDLFDGSTFTAPPTEDDLPLAEQIEHAKAHLAELEARR